MHAVAVRRLTEYKDNIRHVTAIFRNLHTVAEIFVNILINSNILGSRHRSIRNPHRRYIQRIVHNIAGIAVPNAITSESARHKQQRHDAVLPAGRQRQLPPEHETLPGIQKPCPQEQRQRHPPADIHA